MTSSLDVPPLPTLEEIHQGEVLKTNSVCTVVRVRNFVIKYGRGVDLSEGENMKFVALQTTIPVLRVYTSYTREKMINNMGLLNSRQEIVCIIMEYIPGETLESAWSSLSASEKEEVGQRLKSLLEQLRNIKSPYFGGFDARALEHGIFRLKGGPGGPFHTESELVAAIIHTAAGEAKPMIKRFHQLTGCLYGHESIFTHGDLQRKNIIFERVGSNGSRDGSGKASFKLTLLDWEISGFYPSWWEYDSAMQCRPTDDWVDLLPVIVGTEYVPQHNFMQTARGWIY